MFDELDYRNPQEAYTRIFQSNSNSLYFAQCEHIHRRPGCRSWKNAMPRPTATMPPSRADSAAKASRNYQKKKKHARSQARAVKKKEKTKAKAAEKVKAKEERKTAKAAAKEAAAKKLAEKKTGTDGVAAKDEASTDGIEAVETKKEVKSAEVHGTIDSKEVAKDVTEGDSVEGSKKEFQTEDKEELEGP